MKSLFLCLIINMVLYAADNQIMEYRLFNQRGHELCVAHELIDPTLKKIKAEHAAAFFKSNYIKAHKLSDGSYRLEAMGRLNGGGPVLGGILYWGIKGAAFLIAGGGAKHVADNQYLGSSRHVNRLAGDAISMAANAGNSLNMGTQLAVNRVADASDSREFNAACAETAVALVSTAGGLAHAMGWVEAAALSAWSWGCALPCP